MFRIVPTVLLATILALNPLASPLAQASAPVDASAIYAQSLPGIAWVWNTRTGGKTFEGTAWVVDREQRLLVTNHHVVDGCEKLEVFFPQTKNGKTVNERSWYDRSGTSIPGRVIKSDATKDLAVIQVERLPEDVKELRLADSSPAPGSIVHAIGNPGTSQALWVITSSNVRQVYRYRSGKMDAVIVETSLATDPGSSGSPVVNERGEVVGVHFAANREGRLVSLHVEVSEVRKFVTEAKTEVARRDQLDKEQQTRRKPGLSAQK